MMRGARLTFAIALLLAAFALRESAGATVAVEASSTQPNCDPAAAFDSDLFNTNRVWRGAGSERSWHWQIDFGEARPVGAILQINGDHDFVLQHAPRNYRWLGSSDGHAWKPLAGAAATNEHRLFRALRIAETQSIRFARLEISEAAGDYPALREVQFFEKPDAKIDFPEWIVVLNATDNPALPGEGKEFIPLARRVTSAFLPAQQVWLADFNDDYLSAEPRPLCAFISGSFKDWCEVRRDDFQGLAEVEKNGRIPIWASCGGAQALAIIAENGVETAWDCPHCRDPKNPKTPIYTHIGHTAVKPCGDYSGCVFERGSHAVTIVRDDPAFAGLGKDFNVIESHCGQIAYMPPGWTWLVGPGPGTLTKSQAFRREDRPIYAAQFHIEMSGEPATSQTIMKNFLQIARQSGGYRIKP